MTEQDKEPELFKGTLIGNKILHKAVFFRVANSPTTFALGNHFTLKIYPISEQMNTVELYLNQDPIRTNYQSITRPKIVGHKKPKQTVGQVQLIDVKDIEKEELI
jgi:hypothetical protein